MDAVSDETLLARWEQTMSGSPGVGAALVERYAESARRYHDTRHLTEVLDHIDDLLTQAATDAAADEAIDVLAVRLAGWFHDAVYDVRRDDNEEQSALLAEAVLRSVDVPSGRIAEVARLVRVTAAHKSAPGDANAAVLCDADLAILASETARYDAYARDVRAEYVHVEEAAFRSGRAAVLRALLALPQLYATSYGRQFWESPGRANLSRELSTLE